MAETADVIVVGGGLHGCSAAVHLARRGHSVILLEKDHCGRHASGVNAGGVRRLGRALPEIPLSVASLKLWQEIEDLVDDDCGFVASRQIKVAESENDLAGLCNRVNEVRAFGYEHEVIVDRDTLRDLLPAVSEHCAGAIVVEGDGHASPFRTVQAFRRKAVALGVALREGTPVETIRHVRGRFCVRAGNRDFEAPRLVNAAGAWGGRIAAMLGEHIPVRAAAPMLMITARMPKFVAPVVGAAGRTLSFKQFDNGTVLIGGGHEGRADPDANRTVLDRSKLAVNAQTAMDIFPIMRRARVVRSWAGIEGKMPDAIPVIGPAEVEGAFHSFGYSAHGYQLGPICGAIMADLVERDQTAHPIDPFRADRFTVPRALAS